MVGHSANPAPPSTRPRRGTPNPLHKQASSHPSQRPAWRSTSLFHAQRGFTSPFSNTPDSPSCAACAACAALPTALSLLKDASQAGHSWVRQVLSADPWVGALPCRRASHSDLGLCVQQILRFTQRWRSKQAAINPGIQRQIQAQAHIAGRTGSVGYYISSWRVRICCHGRHKCQRSESSLGIACCDYIRLDQER